VGRLGLRVHRPLRLHRGRTRGRLGRLLANDDGLVVAELAITLPVVVLMIGVVLGCGAVGAQLVRVQDAAADVARLLGRGDTTADALAFSERAVPAGALTVERRDGLVCVQLRAPARVMLTLPVVQLHGTACALDDRLAAGE